MAGGSLPPNTIFFDGTVLTVTPFLPPTVATIPSDFSSTDRDSTTTVPEININPTFDFSSGLVSHSLVVEPISSGQSSFGLEPVTAHQTSSAANIPQIPTIFTSGVNTITPALLSTAFPSTRTLATLGSFSKTLPTPSTFAPSLSTAAATATSEPLSNTINSNPSSSTLNTPSTDTSRSKSLTLGIGLGSSLGLLLFLTLAFLALSYKYKSRRRSKSPSPMPNFQPDYMAQYNHGKSELDSAPPVPVKAHVLGGANRGGRERIEQMDGEGRLRAFLPAEMGGPEGEMIEGGLERNGRGWDV